MSDCPSAPKYYIYHPDGQLIFAKMKNMNNFVSQIVKEAMTEQELIKRLDNIEWDDFESKEAYSEIPKNAWETVSAFSNTSGGWLVLGVKETRHKGKSTYTITGVKNIEKMEQDFTGIVRSQTKFNVPLSVTPQRFPIDGLDVLAYYIPSSPIKPVYFNNNISNTFIRVGSGDQRATDFEITALQRDQAFGSRSEIVVPGTSFEDLNPNSFQTYRRTVQTHNEAFLYNELTDKEFCEKLSITKNGALTYGSLLMFGKRDSIIKVLSNFWIDYIEIPGLSYSDAPTRYTFRMQEQENIWEYYLILVQRLRLYVDNPFTAGPDMNAPDDNTQLYTLREGLVNMLAHADYFSPMHSTIRVYTNRIEFQNAGRFIMDLSKLKGNISSMPRNPSIIKFFRYAKLSENAGYGIDKMLKWKSLTGMDVTFESELTHSNVIYYLPGKNPSSTHQVPIKYPTSSILDYSIRKQLAFYQGIDGIDESERPCEFPCESSQSSNQFGSC